jgi:anthranilate/para-aminobenzoate synthase component II
MKIALTQREVCLTNTAGQFTFDALERCWYKFLSQHDLRVIPNCHSVPEWDYDCVIITGGPDSLARHHTENMVYADACNKGKAVIGICHGAFVVNDLEGGRNGTVDGHHGVYHDISMQGSTHSVNSYHSQCIELLAPDFVACAWDQDGHIEAFCHRTRPVHGVVWHPERQLVPVLPREVEKLLFGEKSN